MGEALSEDAAMGKDGLTATKGDVTTLIEALRIFEEMGFDQRRGISRVFIGLFTMAFTGLNISMRRGDLKYSC